MKYSKGKMWIANSRLWKKEMSLWFPNFWGRDLKGERANSMGLLKGRVGVVAIYSRTWAERQVETFVDEEIKNIIRNSGGRAQLLELNIEEGRLFRCVLWVFRGNIREKRKEAWQRYLLLSGIKDDVREILGLMNHKAGYVYLVDEDGKIRWGGSGDALPAEKEAMVDGLKKLIEKRKNVNAIPRVEKAAGAA
jgi:ATPase complex subunit ATP10